MEFPFIKNFLFVDLEYVIPEEQKTAKEIHMSPEKCFKKLISKYGKKLKK